MKTTVHTIRTGDIWWLKKCAPTLGAWCQRHHHDLQIWDETRIPKNYPHPKFCEIDMLRHFLASDADILFHIDADVYVSPTAPAIPDTYTRGLMAMPDPPGGVVKSWPRWLRLHHPHTRVRPRRWTYLNAGVWLCDRPAASAILRHAIPPHHEGCMEQHAWNHWLALAHRDGMTVHHLPQDWNRFPHWPQPAHLYHLAGKNKEAKWNTQIQRGNIQDTPHP
jgi:hypothetical protein